MCELVPRVVCSKSLQGRAIFSRLCTSHIQASIHPSNTAFRSGEHFLIVLKICIRMLSGNLFYCLKSLQTSFTPVSLHLHRYPRAMEWPHLKSVISPVVSRSLLLTSLISQIVFKLGVALFPFMLSCVPSWYVHCSSTQYYDITRPIEYPNMDGVDSSRLVPLSAVACSRSVGL